MQAEFWSAKELDAMWHSGETVFAYQPPYRAMPRDFVAREHALFGALSAELRHEYGNGRVEKHVYLSYNTYADLAIRLFIDVSLFNRNLLALLLKFQRGKCPDHYLSCMVSQFEMSEGGHQGSFAFNAQRLLVDSGMKALWNEQISADFEATEK